MNRDDIDIFSYNLGGSVGDMIPRITADQAKEARDKYLPSPEQLAYFGTQLAPGAASIDAAGGMPGMPSSDANLTDIFDAENNPSFFENIRQGNILDPSLQALGVLGDATYAAGPLVGGLLGSALKAPGAIRKAMKLTGGIDNLPQNIAKAPDGIESVDAARKTIRSAVEEGGLEDFRKLVSDQTKLNTPEMRKMIDEHPFLVSSVAKMDAIPETSTAKDFATQDWFDNRVFDFKDQGKVVGYDDAVDRLYENSRSLGWTDQGMEFPGIPARKPGDVKRAVIVLGPPASGKSSIANPLARKLNASILDPDEAKKLLPEFDGGVGSNATHVESKLITEQVRDIMIGNGDNILIPTVGLDPAKIRQQVKIYKDNGYLVDLVDVSVPADIARIRMLVRFAKSRKLIPPEYIDKVGDLPSKTYDMLKKENIADGYSRIDNSVGIKDAKPLLEDTSKLFEGTDIQLRKSGR